MAVVLLDVDVVDIDACREKQEAGRRKNVLSPIGGLRGALPQLRPGPPTNGNSNSTAAATIVAAIFAQKTDLDPVVDDLDFCPENPDPGFFKMLFSSNSRRNTLEE
uniref:Uncharacterized protein n=1 Tax=Globodera rostochiensis TaxID=31243 RepID=A0A914GXV5_GLORO